MYSFDIAGVVIDVESNRLEPLVKMLEFRRDQPCSADLLINFRFLKDIPEPDGRILSVDKNCLRWLKKSSGSGGYYIYYTEADSGNIIVLADIDEEWQKIEIFCHDYTGVRPQYSFSQQTWFCAHIMMGVIYRYRLLHLNGIVIHSSALKYCDQAVIFSAPSGTGKSTHVKLWHQFIKDVKTLNDDTPAVRIINNKTYIFGTPWSGSSMIHSNDFAPLKAIVILEQAQENKIRKIKEQESILRLMPRTFFPYFDQKMMDKSVSLFEKIILSTPVYLLQCRPDLEAVEMVYKCLY